jgi:Molybdenum cofactor biosynthesis enzyme
MFPNNEMTNKLAQRIGLNSLDECLYYPKYFQVATINICNSKCVMCPVSKRPKNNPAIMSDELFEKFVEEVGEYSHWIESICLNKDNEPTLDRNISKKVKMLKDVGIKNVTFSTNALCLDSSLASELIESGLDDIKISVNALTKETHKKITDLDFDTIVNNTLNIIKLRNDAGSNMVIRVRCVIIKENENEIEEWLKFWESKVKDIDRVYALPEHTWGNQTKKETENKINFYSDKGCISPFSTFLVDVNGKSGLCGADFNIKYSMGDFTTQSIKEIWQGVEFNKVRDAHVSKNRNQIDLCRGCDYWNREYKDAQK